jgi:hypothetical protein
MPAPHTPQQPAFNRAALVPGLLGAIVLLAGLALIGGDWYLYVRYAVSILALILCVFAGQARMWWWFAGLVPLAVVWNPVWPLPLGGVALQGLSIAGAVVFVAAAVTIKIPADTRR